MLHPSPRHAILLIFKVRKLGLRKVWTHVYPVSSKHISAGPGVGVHPAHTSCVPQAWAAEAVTALPPGVLPAVPAAGRAQTGGSA